MSVNLVKKTLFFLHYFTPVKTLLSPANKAVQRFLTRKSIYFFTPDEKKK